MGGDTDIIKERLDIAEVISGYTKVEKAGINFKARCPFHTEKTPSFFISSSRQSFYCFGCGAKGDIFTFVQDIEGIDFKEALKLLADKAGVELKHQRGESKTEKDAVYEVLSRATDFFEMELGKNDEARKYLASRGVLEETLKSFRIGYAPADWRTLYSHLLSLGFAREVIIKAGLAKISVEAKSKEPYDVFRDRIIFPLSDASGHVIAFSGRALSKETEPKYLNSPDTMVFTKSEVLYGLDKAKDDIRKKNFAILVEGQMDLVLSHQAGVKNTVASSGTAFTSTHLERLKRLSSRIILAFDGDSAGEKAAEKSSELALALGMDVKIARLSEDSDPADLAAKDPEAWKEVLRKALPAIEHFLDKVLEAEKDPRKMGKLVEKHILPKMLLLKSAIERSHYVSLIAKRTFLREEAIWEDLRSAKMPTIEVRGAAPADAVEVLEAQHKSHLDIIKDRMEEIKLWKKEMPDKSEEKKKLDDEEAELNRHYRKEILREEISKLRVELGRAETSKEEDETMKKIQELNNELVSIEEKV